MEMLINREFPKRPKKNKLDELKSIGSATISAELKHLAGIEDSFMLGPTTCNPGQSIAGPAITLQFMPIREDYYKDEAEYQNCLLYTSPSPRDKRQSRMPSSA